MFSLENFYDVVYENLLRPLYIDFMHFKTFGSLDPCDIKYRGHFTSANRMYSKIAIAYDQEPLYRENVGRLWDTNLYSYEANKWIASWHGLYHHNMRHFTPDIFLLANSEHSSEKQHILKTLDNFHDWYYFYHGFAALDWFGNIPYREPIKQYARVFITFNNLYTEKRSYRLAMIAQLLNRGLDRQGYISMSQQDIVPKITAELFDRQSLIHRDDKKLIYHTMLPNPPKLIIDTEHHHGALSANDDLSTLCLGMWHIVSETIYYDEKLHLTEKIFKPIVAKRPFILAAAAGNLAYLKSYGFQTFDRWIDESYDSEPDPVKRMNMIINQVERLCRLPAVELEAMYDEMAEVLQYNFDWMYGGFKHMIVGELVDNFRKCVVKHNAGLNIDNANYVNHSHMDWADIKKRLTY